MYITFVKDADDKIYMTIPPSSFKKEITREQLVLRVEEAQRTLDYQKVMLAKYDKIAQDLGDLSDEKAVHQNKIKG